MKINLFRIEFDSVLSMLEQYQYEIENHLTRIQKEEGDRIDAIIKGIKDEDDHDFYVAAAGEEYHYTYEVMFPRSQRYSFVVLLYLNLEKLLTRFCDDQKTSKRYLVRVNDFKGDIVARSKIYLHKFANVPHLPQKVWDAVEDLSKVRNCIVHTLGEVKLSSDQKRIQDIAGQNIGLSIGDSGLDNGFIIIEPSYCRKVLEDVRLLFKELFDRAGHPPAITP